MPRSRNANAALATRLQGKRSGVTFMTNPSGVTIYKNTVQCSNLYNSLGSGYLLVSGTSPSSLEGMKLTTGNLACAGTSLARQSLGLSAIYNVVANCVIKGAVSAVTGAVVVCSPEGEASFGSGCTQVTFVPYQITVAGAAFPSAVTISYMAIGT